ncbi:hypothetical protein [Streptomyces sp. NPDC002671]
MSAGVTWAELGRLLSGIEDDPPPNGLVASVPSGADEGACAEGPDTQPHVAAQGVGTGPRVLAGGLVPEGTPALLFQAYLVVSKSAQQEMTSRDLAVALGWNQNTIGPDLCALLRKVGVERSNGGKIRARYAGNRKPLPGFTTACLRQALDAYAARASESPVALA